MASLALWIVRAARFFPLPAAARRHVDECGVVELFDSVFDPSIRRPSALDVLGLTGRRFSPNLHLAVDFGPSFSDEVLEGIHRPMEPGRISPHNLRPYILDEGEIIELRPKTLH